MSSTVILLFPVKRQTSQITGVDNLKKIVSRIENRLKAVGMSAAAASKAAGLSSSAIYNLKRGAAGKIPTKGGNASTFSALAPVLKTTVAWLTSGDGPESTDASHIESSDVMGDAPNKGSRIPVRGYVGAGAAGHYYAVAQGDLDDAPAPADSNEHTTALEIRGDSLGSFFDRWLVIYDDVRRPATADLIGKLCVVGLPDERVVVKKLRRGKDGLYTLLSQTGEADIKDVEIEWAARVKHMVPR